MSAGDDKCEHSGTAPRVARECPPGAVAGTSPPPRPVPRDTPFPVMTFDFVQLRPIETDGLIRVGRSNDGGYVVPRALIEKCTFVLSYGIKADWSFERGIQKLKPEVCIHSYDHTLNFILLLEHSFKNLLKTFLSLFRLSGKEAIFHLLEVFRILDYKVFFSGKKNIHFAKRVWSNRSKNSVTVRDTLSKIPKNANILLKIDIERNEYRILHDNIIDTNNIIGLIIEFHDIDLFPGHLKRIVTSLKRRFSICHIHGNNYGDVFSDCDFPDTIEVSFIRNDLIDGMAKPSERTYPLIGLDQPNNPHLPDFPIKFGAAQLAPSPPEN